MLIKANNIIAISMILSYLLITTGCNVDLEDKSKLENNIIYFEDVKFQEALFDNGVDSNKDKQISINEVETYNEILDLGNRGIENVAGIQYFINVKILKLAFNNIKNVEPISNMEGLTSLDLSNNEIVDISMLSNCSNLIVLDLSSNKISNIDVISKLINLKFLGLSSNEISNVDIIGNLNDLKYLLIDDNDISDILSLKKLPRLEELWINNTSISSIPDELLLKLKKVNISNTKVKESDIKDITEIIK